MHQNKINILSTRPIEFSVIENAKQNGIDIEIISFIETAPIVNINVQQQIEQAFLQTASIVFTSMNAVEAVANYKEEHQPNWKIYCIGSTTNHLVKKYFSEELIAGTASSAKELAELIVEENNASEVVFFCGDKRRNELPDILKSNSIEVNEIEVYETTEVDYKINKEYNGILFFSPSAAESFFKQNKINTQTILFAIGNTTANEIRKHFSNKIIIANEPSKENLVQAAIQYFNV